MRVNVSKHCFPALCLKRIGWRFLFFRNFDCFAALTLSYFVAMYTRSAIHFYMCVRSSINLHAKMLASILKARIRFFDTNPIGNSKQNGQMQNFLNVSVSLFRCLVFTVVVADFAASYK